MELISNFDVNETGFNLELFLNLIWSAQENHVFTFLKNQFVGASKSTIIWIEREYMKIGWQ